MELKQHAALFQHHYQTNNTSNNFLYGKNNTFLDYNNCLQTYQPGSSLLLEEYIEGAEGCIECIVTSDNVYPILEHEKLILTEKSNTFLENLLISKPVHFSLYKDNRIYQYVVDCIKALGLTYSFAHFEFRLTKEGPVVIEINPRLGGLYINQAFKDIANIDPYYFYISLLIGKESAIKTIIKQAYNTAANKQQIYAMLAFFSDKTGQFQGIKNLEVVSSNSLITHYEVAPSIEIKNHHEENFLLKCWAKVDSAEQAILLHQEILDHIQPIVIKQESS